MGTVTNLERAMWAETTLHDYSNNKEGIGQELYDVGESVVIDLITDLCHLLHLDEKTAGCKSPADIERMLNMAFMHFESEVAEEAKS